LGSNFKFFELNGDYRKYIQIRPKHVLAFHSSIRFMIGEVPFLDLSRLGGEDVLRGYPSNRFIDKNLLVSQVEYRFPLFWRLGMTAFAGAGDVFNNFQDLSLSRLKYSAGLGLRLLVNPKERVNIRLDYARGREGGYFYFSVSEAF
jgi:outer membrane protein assembly factor BamA